MMITETFINYLKLFAAICVLLPVVIEASGKPPRRVTSAVTQRADNGSELCATSPPTESVTANCKIRCLAECMSRESCGDGFNYRTKAQLCELYSDPPASYRVQQDCAYLKKVRSFFYLFTCNKLTRH